MRVALLSLVLVAAALPAQTLYSPGYRAAAEANYDNSLPFGYGAATQSYLQVHGDLKGKPGTFTRIAFRRDGVLATNAAYAAKTFTADVYFGGGVDVAAMSTTFAANYVTARTQVASGKTYSIPDWTNQPSPAPAAFDLPCPLDAPYAWDGMNPFAWEMRVTAMSSTHAMFADAEKTAPSGGSTGAVYGTACTATGQSGNYKATSGFGSYDGGTGPTTSFSWSCLRGIAMAPAAILIGVQGTSIPLPGLCTSLLVAPLVTLSGAGSGNGTFAVNGTEPYNPSHVGVPLYAQCACLDAARVEPIKIALSNGIQNSVPPLPRLACARLYDSGSATATVGTLDPVNTWVGTVIRLD